jgi:polysaccharide biosynthesis protein PelD
MLNTAKPDCALKIENTPPVESRGNAYIHSSAILETIAFLLCVVMLDVMFGGGTRFIDMQLHPFWIIVLMVTLQYGVGDALITAILAGVFLLAGNMPEQNMTETMYEYFLRVTYLPLLWIITALTLGSICTRQLREKKELIEQVRKSREMIQTFMDGYNAVKQSKEQLELRLAEERCSVLTVYKLAKTLETADPENALGAISELVRVALKPNKFSLYRWDGHALALEATHSWTKSDNFIKQFPASSTLTRCIVEKKCILSIVHEEDEVILAGQGMMAGPVFDPRTGKLFGMLKIEDMEFMGLGVHTHEMFRIVCEWIAHIYIRKENARSSSHMPVPQLKSATEVKQFLLYQTQFLTRFAQRHGLNLYKVAIRMTNFLSLSAAHRDHVTHKVKAIVDDSLHGADLILDSAANDEFPILLVCEDDRESQIIVDKMQKAIARQNDKLLTMVKFSYNVEPLHVADDFARKSFYISSTVPQIAA